MDLAQLKVQQHIKSTVCLYTSNEQMEINVQRMKEQTTDR